MSAVSFDYGKAAAIVADAIVYGHVKSAEINGVSLITSKRYKRRWMTDERLQEAVKALNRDSFIPVQPKCIEASEIILEWISRLPSIIESQGPVTADLISSMVEAYKAIEEVKFANRMLDIKDKQFAETRFVNGQTVNTLAHEVG